MFRFRFYALLALGVAVPSTVSCSAIFAPRDDVQRCGSADDCDSTGDNRYVAECRFDEENNDLDTTKVEKICIATFKADVNCDPSVGMAAEDEYYLAHEALAATARHSCEGFEGTLGCPPGLEGCSVGTVNDAGFCDDGSGVHRISEVDDGSLDGQDAKDQFCRSFFCDSSFVCDTGTFKCVPCDPDAPFGAGGCGELYIGGAKSCAYQTDEELASSCGNAASDSTSPNFGCES